MNNIEIKGGIYDVLETIKVPNNEIEYENFSIPEEMKEMVIVKNTKTGKHIIEYIYPCIDTISDIRERFEKAIKEILND